MKDFENEFSELLVSEVGASDHEAQRIAERAAAFRDDHDRTDSAAELIDRMKKSPHEDPISSWNTVIGFLEGSSWAIGDDEGGENPYQL